MRYAFPLLLAFMILMGVDADAQGAYLEKGTNGFGGEAKIELGLDGFQGIEIVSGYSIAGILDVGGSVDYHLGELEGLDASDLRCYRLSSQCGQTVSQGAFLSSNRGFLRNQPGTQRVFGQYERHPAGHRVHSGAEPRTLIRLTPFWLIRAGLFGDYGSTKYITLPEGSLETSSGTVQHSADLSFGGSLGFLFVFPRGTTLALQAELRADQDLELQINPILALAFPQR